MAERNWSHQWNEDGSTVFSSDSTKFSIFSSDHNLLKKTQRTDRGTAERRRSSLSQGW